MCHKSRRDKKIYKYITKWCRRKSCVYMYVCVCVWKTDKVALTVGCKEDIFYQELSTSFQLVLRQDGLRMLR